MGICDDDDVIPTDRAGVCGTSSTENFNLKTFESIVEYIKR